MTGRHTTPPPLDVYLQPAVVGGGLGDIEEVLAVGRRLERLGWTPILYRKDGRPLPASVDGPWGWPAVRRVDRITSRSPRAITVTPWWGVSAAPDSDRSGPWSPETGEIEAVYGMDRVVHLSLEEFARTLTSRQQTRERWREGGVPVRTISRKLEARTADHEIRSFHDEYRKWRALNRSNVLHLFTGFRPSRAFAREFPEAIQAGPLWPEAITGRRPRPRRRRWIWYASPSTSDRLAVKLAQAIPRAKGGRLPLEIEVRGPRQFRLPQRPGFRWRRVVASPHERWSQRFSRAGLRIVTGSRTLLEALVVGGPFLYFNGVMNEGSRTRRHRPEKIETLLEVWRRHGVSASLRQDLSDFSRLRGVRSIVRRALSDPRWRTRFPERKVAVHFPRTWEDAGPLVDRWAVEWANSGDPSAPFVHRQRESARAALSRL
jgi:hypothetical protein